MELAVEKDRIRIAGDSVQYSPILYDEIYPAIERVDGVREVVSSWTGFLTPLQEEEATFLPVCKSHNEHDCVAEGFEAVLAEDGKIVLRRVDIWIDPRVESCSELCEVGGSDYVIATRYLKAFCTVDKEDFLEAIYRETQQAEQGGGGQAATRSESI